MSLNPRSTSLDFKLTSAAVMILIIFLGHFTNKKPTMKGLLCAILGAISVAYVLGHGMVLDPPNRSSMWRFFPEMEPNYDDTEMFCGGYGVQWEVNNGLCGLCGDDFRLPRPRPNENRGHWGKGKIGKTYTSGQVMTAAVLVTTNHWGYFNFSLCNLEDPTKTEPEDCFQQLLLEDGSESYKLTNHNDGWFNVTLQLPQGVKCEQCVLRWWWNTGNTWGQCPDGSHADGCGPQETFMSCSDIAIV